MGCKGRSEGMDVIVRSKEMRGGVPSCSIRVKVEWP